MLSKKYKETMEKKMKLERTIQEMNQGDIDKALKEWGQHVKKVTTFKDYTSLSTLLEAGAEETSRFWQLYAEEQTLL